MPDGAEVIPKIIHNAWFGRGEKADHFKRCMDTWRVIHPDWQYIEMNEDTLPAHLMQSAYIKSVLGRREFVKATELARLYALWKFGGVYLDADVELIKPLDSLLGENFFIGRESAQVINGAVIGSVAGEMSVFDGAVINYLLDAFPLQSDGRLTANYYGPIYLTQKLNVWLAGGDEATVLTPDFFYPYDSEQTLADAVITPKTVAIHHWAKSWVP